MVAGGVHAGGAGTPVNAGFGPIILLFAALIAAPLVVLSQVAGQALAPPRVAGRAILGRLVTSILVYGWYLSLLALLLIGLGAGAYGLWVNG